MEYILTLFLYVNNDLVGKIERPVSSAIVCQELSQAFAFRDPMITGFASCRPRK